MNLFLVIFFPNQNPELPAFSYSKKRLYPALPGRTFICVKDYEAQDEAELALHRGDFVQGSYPTIL